MASDDNLLCHQTRLGNLGTIVLVDGKIIKAVAMITCRHLGQAATRAFSMALTFCLPTTKQWQGLGNLAGVSPFLVSNQCCESLVKSERCGRSRVLWNLEDIEKRMGTDAATGHWCSNTPCATCSVLIFSMDMCYAFGMCISDRIRTWIILDHPPRSQILGCFYNHQSKVKRFYDGLFLCCFTVDFMFFANTAEKSNSVSRHGSQQQGTWSIQPRIQWRRLHLGVSRNGHL